MQSHSCTERLLELALDSMAKAVHFAVLALVSMFCRLGTPLLGFCCLTPLRSRLPASPVCKLWFLHKVAPLFPG